MGFRRDRRQYAIIGAFACAVLVLGLIIRSPYYQLIIVLVLLWATMGLSWNMLSGYSGMISFGHAAFFGLGGYTMTIAFVEHGITPWIGIPLGIVVGIVAGAIIGLPTFRLRGHYFALSMLCYPLAMLYVFEWLGYQEVPLPMMREAPARFAQFEDPRVYIALALALLVTAMLVSFRVERSRFGVNLLAIKQNEPAAEAAGIDPWRWKMLAMMVSAAIAAAAGGLYAVVQLVVTPQSMFGVIVSAQALIVTLFGGVGVFWGPVIGAAILVPLAETLNAELGHIVPGIQGVIYGVAIIVIVLLAPEGIYWRIRDHIALRRQGTGRAAGTVTPEPADAAARPAPTTGDQGPAPPTGIPAPGAPLLQLAEVTRTFGGLAAVDDVSLEVAEGTIHGIIGPNGAGKTTLFNVVNGFLAPNAGSIRFAGEELVGLRPHAVCRRGMGRTFQVVRSFPRMTVLENVVVGALVGAASEAEAECMASQALEQVGLVGSAVDQVAAGLTTKQLRMMELARTLAPRPRLVLLDEPLAGLGHDAIDEMLATLRRINHDGVTIVIIEHTMHAMVRLAHRLSVLDHGRLIADGPPGAVVADPDVIEAYLGRKWMARAQHTVA